MELNRLGVPGNEGTDRVIRRLSRRAFVSSLAALAASRAIVFKPQITYAQQPALPRHIGVILVTFALESKEANAFRQGLRDAGYHEGRDVVIEWRHANGDYGRVPEMVADLIQRKVDVLVADGTVTTKAAKRATTTTPIVMLIVADPVGSGLVTNLAHPGGNVTGLSLMTSDLSAKRLQMLKEIDPRLARVAVLWNPSTPFHAKVIEDLKAAAPSLSIELSFVSAQTPDQFRPAFSSISLAHAQALYVIEDPFLFTQRVTLLKLASNARLPVIYGGREFADLGALMSYGPNRADLYRRSAGYVGKILKGVKPADLPIEQPSKFELVVNLKTAKALGITIPQSILLQADEVIR